MTPCSVGELARGENHFSGTGRASADSEHCIAYSPLVYSFVVIAVVVYLFIWHIVKLVLSQPMRFTIFSPILSILLGEGGVRGRCIIISCQLALNHNILTVYPSRPKGLNIKTKVMHFNTEAFFAFEKKKRGKNPHTTHHPLTESTSNILQLSKSFQFLINVSITL